MCVRTSILSLQLFLLICTFVVKMILFSCPTSRNLILSLGTKILSRECSQYVQMEIMSQYFHQSMKSENIYKDNIKKFRPWLICSAWNQTKILQKLFRKTCRKKRKTNGNKTWMYLKQKKLRRQSKESLWWEFLLLALSSCDRIRP